MTLVAAIGIDDEQNIATPHPNFAVVATRILFLQSGPKEDSRRNRSRTLVRSAHAGSSLPSHSKSIVWLGIRFKRTSVKRVRATAPRDGAIVAERAMYRRSPMRKYPRPPKGQWTVRSVETKNRVGINRPQRPIVESWRWARAAVRLRTRCGSGQRSKGSRTVLIVLRSSGPHAAY
jgi:hypothetical protein